MPGLDDRPRSATASRPPASGDAWTTSLPAPARVLGHPLHPLDLDGAIDRVLAACAGSSPRLVVTLNPEMVVRAGRDALLRDVIARADLVVADGVGMVWAARRAGVALQGRVPGIELAFGTMALGGPSLRVFLLGGRPGVATAAAEAARTRWGVDVVGTHHGFFDHGADGAAVAALVGASGANLVLAGLGERQEAYLDAHRHALGAGALIGVGGTLDVLAGVARRTPAWTRRWGLEWAWRVGLDPQRWYRFPRLARFVALTLRHRGEARTGP
jgi:N-acetylglucosaminyldiphosphoundecaprenol N-acetyl-beta-D-mannosaminyltransferase